MVEKATSEGYTHVVDADIKGYFDNIPHDKLMAQMERTIAYGAILELIESWLNHDIMTEAERWKSNMGTPQGAVISPLIANIYLHPLDCMMTQSGYQMVRYADDFVILCENAEKAEEALAIVKALTEDNGLTLHPDKVHVGDCRIMGEGFEFLGYRFEQGTKHVRKKSILKLRERLWSLTKRNRPGKLKDILSAINIVIKKWYGYFKFAHSPIFRQIDGFIRRRLRACSYAEIRAEVSGNHTVYTTNGQMPSSESLGTNLLRLSRKKKDRIIYFTLTVANCSNLG
jgi:RNA-directed DNA polymerase